MENSSKIRAIYANVDRASSNRKLMKYLFFSYHANKIIYSIWIWAVGANFEISQLLRFPDSIVKFVRYRPIIADNHSFCGS